MSSWLRGIFIASLVLAGLSLFILAATSTDSTLLNVGSLFCSSSTGRLPSFFSPL